MQMRITPSMSEYFKYKAGIQQAIHLTDENQPMLFGVLWHYGPGIHVGS